MASLTTNTWATVSGMITVPAGMNFMKPQFHVLSSVPSGDTLEWDNYTVRKAASAELIVDGSITTNAMTANTINGDRILANTITAAQILANTITAGQIAATTITAAQIAATTITATQIAANTITAGQIAAATITASEIAAGTITGTLIAANTITGANILANTLTADKILVGVVQNVIANPGMETGSVAPHVIVDGLSSITTSTNPVRSGTYGLRLQYGVTRSSGGAFMMVLNGQPNNPLLHLPVTPGDTVHAEFWARAGVASGQNLTLYPDIRDATGAHLAYGNIITKVLTTSYVQFSSDFVISQPTAAYVALAVGNGISTAGDVAHIDDFVLSKTMQNQSITGAIIQTALSGSRMVIQNDVSGGVIYSWTGIGGEVSPSQINPGINSSRPGIELITGTTTTQTGQASLLMYTGSSTNSLMQLTAGIMQFTTGTTFTFGNGAGSGVLITDRVRVSGITNTTSQTANAWLDGSNNLVKVTAVSSKRYKKNISEASLDASSLLQLVPKRFQFKKGLSDLESDQDKWFYGFIAEEADELGLKEWVRYNEEAEPEAFDYASWSVALQMIARDHQEQIEELKAEVAALKAA